MFGNGNAKRKMNGRNCQNYICFEEKLNNKNSHAVEIQIAHLLEKNKNCKRKPHSEYPNEYYELIKRKKWKRTKKPKLFLWKRGNIRVSVKFLQAN